MTTVKQEYKQYLQDKFRDQKINKPLFFNGKFGLRFDMQEGETGTDAYFKEVIKRSALLFEAAFNPNDIVFVVYRDYKWRKRKIRFKNYCFKQLSGLKKEEVNYSLIKNLYDKDDVYNAAIIKLICSRINFKNIFTAIANTGFPPRQPRFKFFGSEEIYFINIAKDIIFHLYDDRGLDIIAATAEILTPIYKNFNNWILKANRDEIDKMLAG